MGLPQNREERQELLNGGWGPWKQGIMCTQCDPNHFISAPMNSVHKIDSVALEELYEWDGT